MAFSEVLGLLMALLSISYRLTGLGQMSRRHIRLQATLDIWDVVLVIVHAANGLVAENLLLFADVLTGLGGTAEV